MGDEATKGPTSEQAFEYLCEKHGITPDNLLDLQSEKNDWTMVIKASALLEASFNGALLRSVSPEAAGESLAKRPFQEKLSLLRRLGYVTQEYAAAARAITNARNSAVHDERAFSFTFEKYLAEIEDKEGNFVVPLAVAWQVVEPNTRRRELVLEQPGMSVFLATLFIVAYLTAKTI